MLLLTTHAARRRCCKHAASVVMPTLTVHVPVRELFFRRVAHVGDLDFEIQVLASERMIGRISDLLASTAP